MRGDEQVLLSTDQFQSVYRLLQEGICKKDSGMKELASCLFSSASARPALERDEWWSGLIGVDMHPSQNAFQVFSLTFFVGMHPFL